MMDIVILTALLVLVICSGGLSHRPAQYKPKEASQNVNYIHQTNPTALDEILDPRD